MQRPVCRSGNQLPAFQERRGGVVLLTPCVGKYHTLLKRPICACQFAINPRWLRDRWFVPSVDNSNQEDGKIKLVTSEGLTEWIFQAWETSCYLVTLDVYSVRDGRHSYGQGNNYQVQCGAIITIINFNPNPHKMHPIARRWGMGCNRWVQTEIYTLSR